MCGSYEVHLEKFKVQGLLPLTLCCPSTLCSDYAAGQAHPAGCALSEDSPGELSLAYSEQEVVLRPGYRDLCSISQLAGKHRSYTHALLAAGRMLRTRTIALPT